MVAKVCVAASTFTRALAYGLVTAAVTATFHNTTGLFIYYFYLIVDNHIFIVFFKQRRLSAVGLRHAHAPIDGVILQNFIFRLFLRPEVPLPPLPKVLRPHQHKSGVFVVPVNRSILIGQLYGVVFFINNKQQRSVGNMHIFIVLCI